MNETVPEVDDRPTRLGSLAARLGCTEGQLYSMVISVVAATALVLVGGVPLGDPVRATASPVPPAPAPALAPSPTVVVPPPGTQGPVPLTPLGPLLPRRPADPGADGTPSTLPTPSPGPTVRVGPFQVPGPGWPRALTGLGTQLFVGTDNSGRAASQLFVLSRTGEPTRQVMIRDQARDHTGGLTAAATRGSSVVATDRSRAVLLEIDPRTGEQRALAQLPDLPPCLVGITGTCQPGAQDLPPTPEGLVVFGPHAYITDAAQGTVWRYAFASRQLTAWYSSGDFSTGRGPSGLAVDTAGRLVFTVGETADPDALLRAALYRLEITTTGSPGVRTLVASFEADAAPGPVAVGRADDVYVGLRAAGGVVVVSRDGRVAPLAGASAAQLPTPDGLWLADGVLYVAATGRPATSSSGRVEAIPVADGPAT